MMRKLLALFLFTVLLSTIISCSTTAVTFKVEPTSHNFGAVNISQTSTFDFIVTNKKSVLFDDSEIHAVGYFLMML